MGSLTLEVAQKIIATVLSKCKEEITDSEIYIETSSVTVPKQHGPKLYLQLKTKCQFITLTDCYHGDDILDLAESICRQGLHIDQHRFGGVGICYHVSIRIYDDLSFNVQVWNKEFE